jgi:hypothetical protein
MTFYKITDPSKRDEIVKEMIKSRKKIQQNSLSDKIGNIEAEKFYDTMFRPITETQKEIKEEIQKIPTVVNIEQDLNKQLAIEEEKKKSTLLGPVATYYMSKFANKEGVDKVFGIYANAENKFYIGNKEIEFDHDDIIIDGSRFRGTEGLWDLIVNKKPSYFTDEDYDDYVRLMKKTNALHQNNDPNNKRPKSSTSKKYKELIKPIWEALKGTTGSGLINRFDLLMASKNAGNTGVTDELLDIVDKLYNENIIDKKEHKILLSKC